MTLTRARTVQYIGILFSLLLIAVGYWYFSVRAGVKTNTSALQPQGVGDLSAGLGGYWALDNGSGTSATDSSTNNSTGTLTNGPTWTTGQIGSAVTFDGTNDYIDTDNGTAIDSITELTYAAWIYPTANNGFILAKGNNGGGQDAFRLTSGNLQGWFSNFCCDDGARATSSTSVTLSTWSHVAMTYSHAGDKKPRLYLNGAEVAYSEQDTNSNGADTDVAYDFWIGGSQVSGTNYFAGSMDEVRIYQRALSGDEVASLYRLTTPTGVDTSLKGYWSFNGDALNGTTAYDWSGAGNAGTLTNGPAIAAGRSGQGLDFFPNGTDPNTYVTMGDPASGVLDFGSGDFSVGFWMRGRGYTSQGSSYNVALCKKSIENQENAGYCFLYGSDNKMSFELGNGVTGIRISELIATAGSNDWNYYFASRSGDEVSLSVNGQVVATSTLSGSVSSSSAYTIGSDTSPDRNANAIIDEVRAYNRALTNAEIKSLYDRGAPDNANTSAGQKQGVGNLDSGLAGYWRLDETTGSSAADTSTNANTGTLTNMENGDWVTGQIGNGLDFDGTNEYVGASALPFTSHSSGTITAWIKSTNGAAAQTIFGVSTLASSNYGGYFHTNANGKLQMRIKGNGVDLVNCGVTDTGSSSQVAASGTWTFVAITNDGAGKKFYKNAFRQGTDCGSDTTWFDDLSAQTPVDASIGAWLVAGGAQTLFQGSIDEVRVYDHALSQDEITNLYRVTTPTAVDTGLKGYWSFNGSDVSGTTAFDRSGVSNNGTLTSGPVITEGVSGQALSFDGSNDYVTVPTNSALNPTAQITVSAWVKRVGIGTRQFIVSKGGATSVPLTQYWLEFTAGNNIVFELDSGSTQHTLTSSNTLTDIGNWHHIVGTYDGTTQRLYIDGIQDSSTLTWSGSINTTNDDLALGNRSTYYNLSFHGLLDEVRVYSRAITASEIKAQYDTVAPDKTNTSVSQSQGAGRLDSGLAGYWRFDETTGSTASDSSTNANNATLYNTENGDWVAGQIGNSIDLDGTNESGLVSYSSALAANTGITYSFWINPDLNDSKGVLGSLNGEDGSAYNYIRIDNSGAEAGNPVVTMVRNIGGSTTLKAVQFPYTVSTWFHYTYTYDGAYERAYVNGAKLGEWAQTGNFATNTEYGLLIGGDYTGGNVFDGRLDELRVYNRALSSDEVSQLYRFNSPTGMETSLKGYWSFNGQDMNGTTAFDRSGAKNNGTLNNGPTATEGRLGQALNFNGSNQYITTSGVNLSSSPFTISFWIKPAAFSGNMVPFSLGSTSSANEAIILRVVSATSFLFALYSDDLAVTLSDLSGKWTHIVVTLDGSRLQTVYQNGVMNPTTRTATAFFTGNTNGAIGFRRDSASEYFNGAIDEVRVYNRALSAAEIKALYDSGR